MRKGFLLQVLHQRVWTGNLHDHDAERRKRPLPGMCEEKVQNSEVCKEWFPSVSWNAYKNDQTRNPPKTIDVEFVCDMDGECTEIWRRLDTGGYLMRKLCNEPFARWLTCHECGASWMDGNCIRPNVTFRNGTQTETVLYDDWNGTAAYNSTLKKKKKKGE